jgi:RNA polymerase sigma-70 factor (ECF subfamily)
MVEALPRFVDRGAPVAAWLFRIAHDRVVDHHRRAVYRDSQVIGETLETGEAGPEAQALGSAEKQQLNELIAQLTDEQRTVIQLRFIEGYSLEECARILGKTIGAIKALQHRALRQMARSFEH